MHLWVNMAAKRPEGNCVTKAEARGKDGLGEAFKTMTLTIESTAYCHLRLYLDCEQGFLKTPRAREKS